MSKTAACCAGLLVCVLQTTWPRYTGASRTKATTTSEPSQRLCYVALLEQRDAGDRSFTRIWYDRGRFRVEKLGKLASNKADVVELRDHPGPGLIWAFSPSRRQAYPTLGSSLLALGREAKRLGVERARQVYGIPKSVAIQPPDEPFPLPLMPASLLLDTKQAWQDAGIETLSGIKCRVRAVHIVPPNPGIIKKAPDTVEGNPVMDLSIAIDPDTQLAMRYDQRNSYPSPSPVPPMVRGYTVKSFRRLQRLDARLFQLPSGASAHIPLIFAKTQLPPGVRRIKMTGAFAATGVDYSECK